ncbi:MAG: cytochrome c [bacterium]
MKIVWMALMLGLLGACDDGGGGGGAGGAGGGADGAPDAAPAVDMGADAEAVVDAGEADAGEVDAAAPDAEMGGAPAAWRLLCAACHGPDGAGTDLGYELRHPVRDYSTFIVRNGREGGELPGMMLAYGPEQVSDAELTEIFDWLDGFEQPTTKAGLYFDYCANCHGRNARGGVVGVTLVGRSAASIRRHVRGGEGGNNYGLRRLYMPAFGADVISDPELDLIVEHLTGL